MRSATSASTDGRSTSTRRGVKARETSRRRRSWSGGSTKSIVRSMSWEKAPGSSSSTVAGAVALSSSTLSRGFAQQVTGQRVDATIQTPGYTSRTGPLRWSRW